MKLIVGLGNPGDKYQKTRHNAGFMAVDYLAYHFNYDPFKKADKHKAEVAEGFIGDTKTLLVKPMTFMNLSGEAVQSLQNFYKIPTEDVFVVYDDVEIPFGSLRIRPKGSAGGHNGIKSMISHLGTQEFPRVRLGIKPEKPFPGALEDYVLGRLDEKETEALSQAIGELPQIFPRIFDEGCEIAMNEYN